MASSPSASSVEGSPPHSSTRLSSLDAFKCPALPNPRTQDVFQSIVKGRKSWKTLRGGEIVWPPELEAALIEGLENYQPDDSRETRLLGRFPMRNRFISEWIYEKTGKRRTAKQVGSRLQQLRDTCGGKRLLNLLSPNRRPCRPPSLSPEFHHRDGHLTYGPPPLRYESESCSDSSASSPTTPTEAHATLQNLLYRGVEPRVDEFPETIVYIDLLPEGADEHPESSVSWSSSGEAAAQERSWAEHGYKIERASQHPRHLRDIDPTITLVSRTATTAQSSFQVHTDDGVVYSETMPLEPLDPNVTPGVDGGLLYRTSLVPGYWENISSSPNASQYVIIQRVTQDAPSSTIFSAMYRFNYVELSSSPTLTHVEQSQSFPQHNNISMVMPSDTSVMVQRSDFGFENLLPMETEGFDDMSIMDFSKVPPPFSFDINQYSGMHPTDEWPGSASSSGSTSVYASPVECNQPKLPSAMNGQLLPSSFPQLSSDTPNYAL